MDNSECSIARPATFILSTAVLRNRELWTEKKLYIIKFKHRSKQLSTFIVPHKHECKALEFPLQRQAFNLWIVLNSAFHTF